MTSLKCIFCLVDRDICNSSVPPAWKVLLWFQGWQALSSFLFALREL